MPMARRFLVILGLAGCLQIVWATPAAASSCRVIQWNICGAACWGGSLGVVTPVAERISHHAAIFASLQEVCEPQFDAIVSSLGPLYQGYFNWTRNDSDLPAGCDKYGIGIIWRTTFGFGRYMTGTMLHHEAGTEPRLLVDVQLEKTSTVRFDAASTHLSLHEVSRELQIQQVASILEFRFQTLWWPVLGGDLNNVPYGSPQARLIDPLFHSGYGSYIDPIDPRYNWSSSGNMIEATGCCTQRLAKQFAYTNNAGKIDYIFSWSGSPLHPKRLFHDQAVLVSDHALVVGVFEWVDDGGIRT